MQITYADVHLGELGDEGFTHPNEAIPVLLTMYRMLGGMAIHTDEARQADAVAIMVGLLKETLDELQLLNDSAQCVLHLISRGEK